MRVLRTFPVRSRRDLAIIGGGLLTGATWNLIGLPFWPLYFLPFILFAVLTVYFFYRERGRR